MTSKNKKKVVIYLYNRLFDSLIQSNFWLYIKDYLEDENSPIDFALVTYEDPRFPLTEEQLKLVEIWQAKGLVWYKLIWHPGTGLHRKFLDVIQGFFCLCFLRLKGYKHALSLGSVAGTFLYLYSLFTQQKFHLYQFEPHSEYARDNKMWGENSLQFKISHYLERKASHRATVIASGTKFMEERLKQTWQVKGAFVKIATVANAEKFLHSETDRKEVRARLGISDDTQCLFYPGKFGDLYYREELAFAYKWLKEEIPELHFLIVTPHTDKEVIALFDQADVPREHYSICHSDYADIHTFFSAADFAVISVPPGPSKCFISNIKVGEYLFAGLPFLITEGISEDYIYALEKDVGVVVKDFIEPEIKAAAPKIKEYLDRDRSTLREHCRKTGTGYRGFEHLNCQFKKAINILVT